MANRFLDAAAQLIDATLVDQPAHNPPRLRALHYPAALDWIRIEDVLRLTRQIDGETASKRALANRWASKDAFIQDAIVHALMYRDAPATQPAAHGPQLHTLAGAASLSTRSPP